MADPVMFDSRSAGRIAKVVKAIEGNPDAITYYQNNGNNTKSPETSNLPLHVYILSDKRAAVLYQSNVYWYRFSLNTLITQFNLPVAVNNVTTTPPLYVVSSIRIMFEGEESDWIEVPQRLPVDTNRSYYFRFMTAFLGGLKTLPSYDEKQFRIEYTDAEPTNTFAWPFAQFTLGRPVTNNSSEPIPLPPERQVQQLIIQKVRFRRRIFGANQVYDYDGPPTSPMFVNPYYFTRSNYYYSSNSQIDITILAQPNYANYVYLYDSMVGTEGLAFPTANRGYVILNVARSLFYPMVSHSTEVQ
jgi:hypothetical protein